LAGLRLLHDRDPQAAWESWREIHGPARLALQGCARYTSSDLVLRAAAQGQRVALARHRVTAADVLLAVWCVRLANAACRWDRRTGSCGRGQNRARWWRP